MTLLGLNARPPVFGGLKPRLELEPLKQLFIPLGIVARDQGDWLKGETENLGRIELIAPMMLQPIRIFKTQY